MNKTLIDLREHFKKVDELNNYLTHSYLSFRDGVNRKMKQGSYMINPKILREVEEYFNYDDSRTPTHKFHKKYIEQYKFYRHQWYLPFYLRGGQENKHIEIILDFSDKLNSWVLHIKNI